MERKFADGFARARALKPPDVVPAEFVTAADTEGRQQTLLPCKHLVLQVLLLDSFLDFGCHEQVT